MAVDPITGVPDTSKQIIEATLNVVSPATRRPATNYVDILGNVTGLLEAVAWPCLILYLFLSYVNHWSSR